MLTEGVGICIDLAFGGFGDVVRLFVYSVQIRNLPTYIPSTLHGVKERTSLNDLAVASCSVSP